MLSQTPAVVGFFPPDSIRLGDVTLCLSYAQFLSEKGKRTACVLPGARVPAAWESDIAIFDSSVLAGDKPPLVEVLVVFIDTDNFAPLLDKSPAFFTWCLVGVSPTVPNIPRAKQLAGRLLTFGIPKENVWRVLWNDGMAGQAPVDTLEKHLGAFRAKLPFDPNLSVVAENKGQPVQRIKPKAALSLRLGELARDTLASCDHYSARDVDQLNTSVDWMAIQRQITSRLWRSLQEQSESDRWALESISQQIDQELHTLISDRAVQGDCALHLSRLRQNVLDHVAGLGPLEKFIRDPTVNEIMVNGADAIFIERDGTLEKTEERFDSQEQLQTVIDRAVAGMGRRVDTSSPFCDVRLPDGSRVNVILPPLALSGPTITVRRFKPLYRTLDDLIFARTVDAAQAGVLESAVRERKNILVAGNSGAGKTTLLNVLAGLIPERERIITLEDAAELQIMKPHVVRLETRPKNAEGLGEVTMSDLLVNALRMRPDRIVIGECRGVEAVPMLQAMNTGHDGSMTTLHANSAEDALKRLESMILLGAPKWPVEVVREQIAAGVDMVVYLKRSGPERKLLEIMHV